jgi:hypothetical protein
MPNTNGSNNRQERIITLRHGAASAPDSAKAMPESTKINGILQRLMTIRIHSIQSY